MSCVAQRLSSDTFMDYIPAQIHTTDEQSMPQHENIQLHHTCSYPDPFNLVSQDRQHTIMHQNIHGPIRREAEVTVDQPRSSNALFDLSRLRRCYSHRMALVVGRPSLSSEDRLVPRSTSPIDR